MKSRCNPRADDLLDLLTERARLIVFVDQRISAGQSGARWSEVDFGDMNNVERRSDPPCERRPVPNCLERLFQKIRWDQDGRNFFLCGGRTVGSFICKFYHRPLSCASPVRSPIRSSYAFRFDRAPFRSPRHDPPPVTVAINADVCAGVRARVKDTPANVSWTRPRKALLAFALGLPWLKAEAAENKDEARFSRTPGNSFSRGSAVGRVFFAGWQSIDFPKRTRGRESVLPDICPDLDRAIRHRFRRGGKDDVCFFGRERVRCCSPRRT